MTKIIHYIFRLHEGDLPSINRLIGQLSKTARTVEFNWMRQVTERSRFLLAVDAETDEPVGMATLTYAYKPTGFFGTIEDVVVAEGYQRKGIGEELVQNLIGEGRRMGMDYVELTSRPSREAAQRLYKKLGFSERETNVFRFELK